MMFFGLDLVIVLPLLAGYVIQWWLKVRYPRHKETIKTSSVLAIVLFIIFSRLWMYGHLMKDARKFVVH